MYHLMITKMFKYHIYKPGNWTYGYGKPGMLYELAHIYKINENNVEDHPIDVYLENPREILINVVLNMNNNIN